MAVTFEQVGALFSFAQVALSWTAALYVYALRPPSWEKRLLALSLAVWGAAQAAGLVGLFASGLGEASFWFFVDMGVLHAFVVLAFAFLWPSRLRARSLAGLLWGFALVATIVRLLTVTVLRDEMRGAALGDLAFWVDLLGNAALLACIVLRLPDLSASERASGSGIALALGGGVVALASSAYVGGAMAWIETGSFFPSYQDGLAGPGVLAAKAALIVTAYVVAPAVAVLWYARERSVAVPVALAYGILPAFLAGTQGDFFLLFTIVQAVAVLVVFARGRAFGVTAPDRQHALLLSAVAGGAVFLVALAVALGYAGDSALVLASGSAAGAVLGGTAVYLTLPRGSLAAVDEAESTRRVGVYTLAFERELRAGRTPDEAHETLRELREVLGVAPVAVAPPADALLLGRYRPVRELGAGANGTTQLCLDERVGREVVLKSMRGDDPSPERVAALLREARAIGAIRHPNVITLYDVVQSGRDAVIVMEHAERGSLRDALRAGPLTREDWARLARGLLSGLEAVHAAGVVHRDVKPSNVLLGADGEPKLADFGVARVPGFETTVGGLAESAVGTFRYMSPEQAKGRPATARSDLFSAAATLYEALVGGPYLEVRAGESAVEVQLRAASAGRFDRPVPPELRAWFSRALDPDPAARFATAREMRETLP